MTGSSDLPVTEEGNCAESDRDFDCAYRIHFDSRSADERLERRALGAQTVRGSLQRDKRPRVGGPIQGTRIRRGIADG